ncbi:hypothetical protein UPYG_G00032600 [Umbra pygmaea]|uniref:Origin recognition complex subunit 1 n=1 Tax=Umbra pygmaea TaxID=75934 RepID=A0ABD0XN77_UMBPY
MVGYFTRLRVRRVYRWGRRQPTSFHRKLNTFYFDSLTISVDGQPGITTVNPGDYVLIEGDDDDYPFVAKILEFFNDETHNQKMAQVQWFIRWCELPHKNKKLLGRSPHPHEVFYYLGHSCDNEINAESILSTVQVQHIPASAPFPESPTRDTLYVKLSWDTKTFKELDPALMQDTLVPASPPPRPKPFPHCSPPTASLLSRAGRSLPTPDPMVMRRAGSAVPARVTMSAGKMGTNEAESVHSAAKLSASKTLSAKRRGRTAVTPGVRKKLQLSLSASPEKGMTGEEVLCELLDEEVESEKVLAIKLNSSPPRSLQHGYSLCNMSSGRKPPSLLGQVSLTPYSINLDRLSPSALGEQDSSRDMMLGVAPLLLEDEVFEAALPTDTGFANTPKKRQATPRRKYFTGQKATTPSRRKDSSVMREPALGVLAEEDAENSPMQPVAMTPRSKRKSAQLVASRIRKQLDLLDSTQDLSDEDDCYVPSKKQLQSSSEEEMEEEEAAECEETRVRKTRGRIIKAPATPARTPRKTPSKKATPSTPRTPRDAIPSIPSRTLPARQPGNILEEARARLHVSSVPESLPCREQEFQDIYNFVESKVMDGTGGCMYISGVPGTGKTATVHEVIRCLQHASDIDEIPTFRFIEINGMKMTDPHQAYVQILQKLTDQKATADHAAALLEKRFSNSAPRKETTVLLVDELDLLWTRKQNVMYNLFDWPTRRHARLVVLTIANTMDLPERIMINRVASRLGLTRMSFQPYSFKQLQQIITSRLNKVKAFEEDALQLVSRKVAALSGDARRCLDICRRATEICEHSASLPSSTGLVGMSHVMEALDEMFSSSYITAIRCASVQEQLFLRAILAEFRRLGLEEATFQQVFVQHQALCRVEGLQPISTSEGLAVCQRLGACRLLLLESSRLDVLQRVRLNVSQDDVLYALKVDRD